MFALWLLALAMLAPAHAAKPADGPVPVPPLQSRLTDLTGTLSADQQTGPEQSLRAFEARKGTQIAALMVPTTKPEEIEQYALRVVEQWKLGRKKVDDGALLLIARVDRTLRIELGRSDRDWVQSARTSGNCCPCCLWWRWWSAACCGPCSVASRVRWRPEGCSHSQAGCWVLR